MRSLILAVIFFLAAAAPVFACECTRWRFVEYDFERHPTVVIAEVQSVRLIKKKKGTIEVSVFAVVKSYKGKYKAGDKITLRRESNENCTWSFVRNAPGKQFLIYLDGKSKSGPSTCSRTGRMEDAYSDVTRIEKLVGGSSTKKD